MSCSRVISQVSRPCLRVAPVSLYQVPSPLHSVLRRYKDLQSDELSGSIVAALLGRFLLGHWACVTNGDPWDVLVVVPSTTRRAGPHPLERLLQDVPWLGTVQTCLLRGAQPGTHLQAGDHVFEPTGSFPGLRVLLVDDTWTSGARAQSAASALQLAGAIVLATVVVGRVVDPHHPRVASRFTDACRRAFGFERCCMEDPSSPIVGSDHGTRSLQPPSPSLSRSTS